MKHFLFEDKEYKIKPSFQRGKPEGDSAKELAKLLRNNKPSGGGRSGGGQRKTDERQNCVVKVQYSKSLDAHKVQLEKYLTREGTERDGSRAKLYGSDTDEYKENMVNKNFRIFLSPQSDKVDLKVLSETFVKRLEVATGYRLYWQAANHYNTAHPHTHLLINGRDKMGRDVNIPRDIVKTFMREYARDICTSQIGSRTHEDIKIEKEKQLQANRHTKLDEKIRNPRRRAALISCSIGNLLYMCG
jgi:type IV secretory pathway VirD2 relaxase